MTKKYFKRLLLLIIITGIASFAFFIYKLFLPYFNREYIDKRYRQEAAEYLLERYQTGFNILEQTDSNDEHVIVEYNASLKDNPDIVCTVTFGYTNEAIGFIPPLWHKSKWDNFEKALCEYTVNQCMKENPIVISKYSDLEIATKQFVTVLDIVRTLLPKYHITSAVVSFPLNLLGNNTTIAFDTVFDDYNKILSKLEWNYKRQININKYGPIYDYEYRYSDLDFTDADEVMIDDTTVQITLYSTKDWVYFSGYKEYRKSGEFAYLYIIITNNKSEAMRNYTFDYDISDINKVYLCNGDGNTKLIWNR